SYNSFPYHSILYISSIKLSQFLSLSISVRSLCLCFRQFPGSYQVVSEPTLNQRLSEILLPILFTIHFTLKSILLLLLDIRFVFACSTSLVCVNIRVRLLGTMAGDQKGELSEKEKLVLEAFSASMK